ncbi:MAG: Gfo/Idh/MocA family oxidoreductase [Chloroflexota bacterium]|nr:Gfo/Idh/MocA family oxidoreductase [Chloroflexota bacterium]
MFNVGIVGAGVIGELHARAIQRLDSARVVAICEPREDAGRKLASEHEAQWYPGLEELLDRPDLDVVILGTPSGLHPDQAIMAAQAGKHVISEKPMAVSLEGADRMIAAAREAGTQLAVIFQNRYNRDALKLKRAAEAGLFGRPVLGNALVHWRRTQEYYDANGGWRGTWALDGGGALINQSIHTIDLLQWVMGPVDSLSAYTATLNHEIETEDTASAALRFASGALGAIQGATCTHRDHPIRLEILGTEGSAVLENSRLTSWEPGRDEDVLTPDDLKSTEGEGDAFGDAHTRQLKLIFEAIEEGRQPPVPGEEARKALEIILAIYRSAQTGERVSLPLTGVKATAS